MALTFAAIKNPKGREKPYKLTDSDGLFLYVTPNGGRYWRMNYRHTGKQKTLAFGVYPDTGLAEAREQRDVARKVLAKGDDPAEKIELDRLAATVAAANSFKAAADSRFRRDARATSENWAACFLPAFRRDRAEADIVTPVRWHRGRRTGGVPQMRPILLP
jgi:hypothetical protein